MNDEMLRKLAEICALVAALDFADVDVEELFTGEESDALDALLTEAVGKCDPTALMKTMLREHLADILVTREEGAE